VTTGADEPTTWAVSFDHTERLLLRKKPSSIENDYRVLDVRPGPHEKAFQKALVAFDGSWHTHQAATASAEQEWFAAAFHLDRLIEQAPRNIPLRGQRIDVCAEMGQWDRVWSDYEDALKMGVDNPDLRFCRALVRLASGNRAGYRRLAAAALRRWGGGTSREQVNGAVWAPVLADGVVNDVKGWVARAEKNLEGLPPGHKKRYDYTNTLGAVLYRAGRYADAVKRLEEAIKVHGKGGTAGDWVFLALAHHRLGHAEEARRWLDKVVREQDRPPGPLKKSQPRQSWITRTQERLLRLEAEGLLRRRGVAEEE
jgi:tetratricopeptide (TPR) repeat protein